MTFDDVRRIGLVLTGAEDGLSYGAPALKVNGQLMVRYREDLDAIVVRTTFDQRQGLIADDPDVYFITDHYLDYPWVLVRLDLVKPDALLEMINIAQSLARKQKKAGTESRNL